MNDPRRRQAAFNASSRDQWDAFAGHRRNVADLLGAGRPSKATRLCVLGAGNGNDLDLPGLLDAHREVHLVDLDSEALARGASRQGVADRPALHRHGGIDITGMLDVLDTWSPRSSIRPEVLTALVEWPAARVRLALPGSFDLVASTCLLSPLIGNAHHAVGESHPQFPDLVRAIRRGHLRLLTLLTAPGGTAVLITDVASNETFPGLDSWSEPMLTDALPRLSREARFFHGVDPRAILSVFRNDPVLSSRATALEPIRPWRWNLHGRVYLVWALRYRVVGGSAT